MISFPATGGMSWNATPGHGVQSYGNGSSATSSLTAAVPSTEDTAPPHNQVEYSMHTHTHIHLVSDFVLEVPSENGIGHCSVLMQYTT